MLGILLGLGAGALTPVAGVGGGTLLLLGLAAASDPLSALVTTAPALLVGNLHRLWLLRRAVRRDIAGRILLGAVPGALAGGLLAVGLPEGVLRGMMGLRVVLVLLRGAGWSLVMPPAALAPAGLLIGGIQATGGGSGPLVATLLQTLGLSGAGYVATASLIAASMHAARLLAYGLGGAVQPERILQGVLIAAAIAAGNLCGVWLGRRLSAPTQARLQQITLLATILLAAATVGAA